jgi:T5SS/PEP-CTERM-associated repeat protein
MFSIRRLWQRRQLLGALLCARQVLTFALCCSLVLFQGLVARAAISSSGDISPVPPAAGGAVTGPFHIGDVDVATMTINTSGGPSPLTNTNSVLIGETVTGIGIVNMSGFGSDWTLISSSADMTVGHFGAGSVNLSNLAFVSVFEDLFLAAQLNSLGEISISGFGTIFDVGDDAFIGQRGQAAIDISNGGRLVTDLNIIGQQPTGDGRVTVSDQFSLWRQTNTMVIADAGRGLLQILDGGRVETAGPTGIISTVIADLAGSTGTVEVVGLGSIWQNALGMVVGSFGHGTLTIGDGGRVSSGTVANPFVIGQQIGSTGHVEVSGRDSLLSAATIEVGDSGDGRLHILDRGRFVSGTVFMADNSSARGEALVDGVGSTWEVTGEINVSAPGQAHLTISNGGLVRSSSLTQVGANGRLTLDDGRLEIGGTVGLLNTGTVEGNGTIEAIKVDNSAGGRIWPQGAEPLVITGTLNNLGLVDVQSGILEVNLTTNNSQDIDARDGAILRFRGAGGLDNNSGAQLAITSGVVDVFGSVTNDAGAEIAVGGTAVAVFHDAVNNAGTIFVQPGGEIFMLENLGFSPSAAFGVGLQAIDETDPDTEPSDAFGQIQVSGAASLAGTLEVSLLEGYMPMAGDSFQILTAGGGRTGIFSNEVLPSLSSGLDWDLAYNPNSVVLSVISTGLPGDYNGDGRVDAADYVVWRKNDGGQSGYDLWRTNFGRTAGSGAVSGNAAASAVPEPSSLIVACWLLVTIWSRRARTFLEAGSGSGS